MRFEWLQLSLGLGFLVIGLISAQVIVGNSSRPAGDSADPQQS